MNGETAKEGDGAVAPVAMPRGNDCQTEQLFKYQTVENRKMNIES
jgi:hypothetical protein